jgi:hypothetical protein
MRIKAGIAVCLLLAATAWAQDWTKSFDVKGTPEIVLRMNDGHMVLKSWNQPRVQATLITTGYAAGDWEVFPKQTGDRVEIEVRKRIGQLNWGWGMHTFRLEVTMPAKSNVDAETKDGHVEAYNLSGNIQVHTGDGHISGHDLGGVLKLRTGDGHINLNRVNGALTAHTGDGHVTVDGRFDELEVDTGDGHVRASIASGSVMKNSWKLATRDGQVSVDMPSDFSAELEAHTGDGRIRTDLRGVSNPDRRSERNDFRAQLGRGGRTFTIRTGDGSIHLTQR